MSKKTVLIVDDNDKIVKVEKLIFSMEGYDVLTAKDGNNAIELLKTLEKPPDIILVDMLMPGISGLEVCHWIRQQSRLKNIPVLFLTASVSQKTEEDISKVGGNEYFTKPYSVKKLFKSIENYLNS